MRHPQEIASVGRTVRLVLAVKRFRCTNSACTRQTFAEPLAGWLPACLGATDPVTHTVTSCCRLGNGR